jgi:DNA-directed RNA polymerase subunit M/transcription elongation factor TFIIS
MPRYVIVFTCGNCGYVLHTFKSKQGRGLYHIPKIHKRYFGKCPACGKELDKKPKRIEFTTLKEHKQYLEVEASTTHLTVRIPTWMYDHIVKLVKSGVFKSKSEFIVKAILKMLEHGLH